ncbi:unnamed protein product [Rhodiola kirilowii]
MKKSGSKREFEFEPLSEEEDDQECMEESARPDKKRRLRADQVKALERSFESENKLEPERKVQLAIELGLDPRQVAIWFQNRRARWKTKQLERDYVLLKSAFDDLEQSYDAVRRENETLIQQIAEMKMKMKMEAKKEEMIADGPFGLSFNYETAFYSNLNVVSSDSATSGVLSEDHSTPNGVVSSHEILGNDQADIRSPAIWPASYTFLADEEPASMFNWYCPDPWT